jgi:hypothetical protein
MSPPPSGTWCPSRRRATRKRKIATSSRSPRSAAAPILRFSARWPPRPRRSWFRISRALDRASSAQAERSPIRSRPRTRTATSDRTTTSRSRTTVGTIFTGFGGACEKSTIGDPVVLYDQLADRWVITEIAEDQTTGKWIECFAFSKTGDPLGQYRRHYYTFTRLNDYPKMGVWPDGYYYTVNLDGADPMVCALNRQTAITGGRPKQQCFQFGTRFSGTVLPADLDGKTAPPSGAPNYLVGLGDGTLSVFNLHIDWATKSNSKLSTGQTIKVASFSSAEDVPQPRGDTLEALSDRLMNRLAYRNFGDHESLVVNHSVDAGGHAGVRWYEVRSPKNPNVFQQGTFAPDTRSRWMGSVAMDKKGNIAAGYSIGSATELAGIGYAGRLASDPLGTFGQGEGSIVTGTGAQSGIGRWGDYSAMVVDPLDDCTFWYTTEYMKTDGGKVWHTRVASFKMPGCN